MEDKKLIFKELEKKDFTYIDEVRAVRVWNVIHSETGEWTDDDFTFHLFSDGRLVISANDRGEHIYLPTEITNVLRILFLQLPGHTYVE
jgi:hypothetical protein